MNPGSGSSGHAYGEASYWDNRYKQDPGPFDWYQKYVAMAPIFDLYLRRHQRVLLVGCGNSVLASLAEEIFSDTSREDRMMMMSIGLTGGGYALGEEMVADGYEDIVNVDISSVVIDAMREKHANCPQMKYIQMDVRDMSAFNSRSFDAVVDKGTLDSLMCGSSAQQNSTKMLEEIDRILKDGGAYILITYGDPKYRLYLLQEIGWTINLHVISRPERIPREDPWELTKPIPLLEDGSFATTAVSTTSDIHYIYVCIKDKRLGGDEKQKD